MNWSLAGAPNQCLILLILTPLAQSQTMLVFAPLAIETYITLTIEISPSRHTQCFMKTEALLDSGANTIYIDKAYAQKMKLPLTPLSNPVPVYNVDGTCNATRSITHCAEIIIQFQKHHEKVTAEVTDLGKNQMILGYTWLLCYNSEIDWTTGTVKMTWCPWMCHTLKGKPPFS